MSDLKQKAVKRNLFEAKKEADAKRKNVATATNNSDETSETDWIQSMFEEAEDGAVEFLTDMPPPPAKKARASASGNIKVVVKAISPKKSPKKVIQKQRCV